ncbi:MAG: thioredoxin [Planctomycetota bacterium]|nr:thioredoxin [Planctomycetota bacterium]
MATKDATKDGAVHLTSESFDELINREGKPVLVDFWAEWCGPCRVVGPTVDAVAKEFQGRAVVAKLNVDDAQDVASEMGITAIPTMIIFKNGKAVDRFQGIQTRDTLAKRLEKAGA